MWVDMSLSVLGLLVGLFGLMIGGWSIHDIGWMYAIIATIVGTIGMASGRKLMGGLCRSCGHVTSVTRMSVTTKEGSRVWRCQHCQTECPVLTWKQAFVSAAVVAVILRLLSMLPLY